MAAMAAQSDSAHDALHIGRVLRTALDIAGYEEQVDEDILTAACLLHDIGRPREIADPRADHALVGGEMAEQFLTGLGWSRQRAAWVRASIETHRYRKGRIPQNVEGRILFDADKLDVSGAMGIARTLQYGAILGDREPLYRLGADGRVLTASDSPPSFFQEYNFKLRGLAGKMYTARGRELALQRQKTADAFYDALLAEIQGEG